MAEPEKNHPRPGPIRRSGKPGNERREPPQEPPPLDQEQEPQDPAQSFDPDAGYGPEDFPAVPEPAAEEDQEDFDFDEEAESPQEPRVFAIRSSRPSRGPVRKTDITPDMFYEDESEMASPGVGAITAARKRRDMILIGLFVFAAIALLSAIFIPTDLILGRPEELPVDESELEDIGLEKLENLDKMAIEREVERQREQEESLNLDLPATVPGDTNSGLDAQGDIRELLAPTIGVTEEAPDRNPNTAGESAASQVQQNAPAANNAGVGETSPDSLTPEEIQKELEDLESEVLETMQDQESATSSAEP